jgi:hypothetical protein
VNRTQIEEILNTYRISGLVHHLRMLESKRRANAKLAESEKQAAEEDVQGAPAGEREGGKLRKRDIHWETM